MYNKVFEKLFLNRLLPYPSKFHLLPGSQYGFQKGKSTTSAMGSLIDFLVKSFERKKMVTSVFLDLFKAFDCVDFETLFIKLKRSEVRGAYHFHGLNHTWVVERKDGKNIQVVRRLSNEVQV